MTLAGERPTMDREPGDMQPGEVFERSVERRHNLSGHQFERRLVAVGDISKPEDRARMFTDIEEQEQILRDHPEWPLPTLETSFVPNPVFDRFYNRYPGQDSMRYWRDTLVPHAPALYPLQRLNDAGRLFPNGVVDPYAMDIFTNHEESVAIRSRGAIYRELVLNKAKTSAGQELKAVALGAGAGVPNIDATVAVTQQDGKRIVWDMYDWTYKSLEFAKQLAIEAGIPGADITTHRADYRRAFRLTDESVDIADMLGLMEYLPRQDCVDAIHELYRLLKPGGMLVVSNMLDSRSHLDFHQRGLQWPGVVPRSEDDLVDMVAEAGIDTELLTMTIADDGIYAVLEIHKP